jgi:hypothetical protein
MLLWIVDKRPLVNKTYPDGVIKSPWFECFAFSIWHTIECIIIKW